MKRIWPAKRVATIDIIYTYCYTHMCIMSLVATQQKKGRKKSCIATKDIIYIYMYVHRRTGTTELGGAAPVCPKTSPPKRGLKPCLPEHLAQNSFLYYINFGRFARKNFYWGGLPPPPRPLGSYAYVYVCIMSLVTTQLFFLSFFLELHCDQRHYMFTCMCV